MLTDYFYPVEIYVRTESDFDADVYTYLGIYLGFIQPISGDETFAQGKNGERATHRFYTGMNTPVKYGYKVIYNGQEYIMLYAIQPDGISGVGRHKEITMGLFE